MPPRSLMQRAATRRGRRPSRPIKTTVRPATSIICSRGGSAAPAAARLSGSLSGAALHGARPPPGRRLAFLSLFEALPQGVHQVDHLAPLRRLGDDRLLTLHLRLHQFKYGLLIPIREHGWIERSHLLRDQLPSEIQELVLDQAGTNILEIGLMAAD